MEFFVIAAVAILSLAWLSAAFDQAEREAAAMEEAEQR